MRADLAVRVMPEQARVDFHALKTVSIDCKARHFLVVQAGTDRDAAEIRALLEHFLKTPAILWRD
jgi:hypothetical protein